MATLVLSLADEAAVLENVGGKGMSLARLARAGLPVPDGFHLTTEAYRLFVAENQLAPGILTALKNLNLSDAQALEVASGQIAQLFAMGHLPPAIANAVTQAYAAFHDAPVAVRSSATAEDLPGASFAGQQDTYLNIHGTAAVLGAIQRCWASLWTARAIAYRARQGISPDEVALAVVVQKLVPAEAAGVMFTANPVNGQTSQLMITAAWGLGEALVSGAVTPDTLVIDKVSGMLLSRQTASKQVMTVRTPNGTVDQPMPPALQRKPVLRAAQAMRLAKLGSQIEQLYGMPMDIEWTLAGGEFAIVQARPVTSLPDAPLAWVCPYPKSLMIRGSFAEFLPDPVSPLFATLAVPIAREASVALVRDALGMQGTDSYLMAAINGYIYIGVKMTFDSLWPMVKKSVTESKKMLTNSTQRWQAAHASYLERTAKWQQIDPAGLAPSTLLEGAKEIFSATADYFTVVQASVIPAATSSEVAFSRYYTAMVKGKTDPAPEVFLIGLDNQALRGEKALYDLAGWIQTQAELAEAVSARPADELARLLVLPADGSLWDGLRARFSGYLSEYGQAIYDLDFAKPLPADEPAPLLEALKIYLSGSGSSPYLRQQAAEQRRAQAEAEIVGRLDSLRRKGFLKLLKWAQNVAPYREDGIAGLGLGYPALRRLLGELGKRFTACGAIAAAGDIYWLEEAEAAALAAGMENGQPLESYCEDVAQRKARWQRNRCAQPPMSIPEKSWVTRMMLHENLPDSRMLKGFGASAGVVTGPACVMLGPEDFGRMRAGDVIVAVTTTPAWTPLFALASAVVTDIGGPLSHSSIVAREYGIPAVMATSSASRRIQNGQTIMVDGGAGTVTLL